jgi:hypothetical protein
MTLDYILNKIYDFSKVKETFETISTCPKRMKFIIDLLNELNIENFIDVHQGKIASDFSFDDEIIRNVICPGTSNKMVIAHYDILNWESDNANDNSASIINLIALKYLRPDIHVVFTDYEEFGCVGVEYLTDYIRKNKIKWVLNLELTGLGENLISSNYNNGSLFRKISKFNPIIDFDLKRNDGRRLTELGIQAETICLCPIINEKLDFSHFDKCHKESDSIDTIKIKDMKNFVENILTKIV